MGIVHCLSETLQSIDRRQGVAQTPAVSAKDRVERTLERALELSTSPDTAPRLAEALRYAVFSGGGRARPKLVFAVARACGGGPVAVVDAAAAAVELLHCASLVHDDLPCFDNASMRRGRPSVHCAYGTEIAVLVGDGLIVSAFEVLAEGCRKEPVKLAPLVSAMAHGVGAARGIVAGQAWESEPMLDLHAYHRAKTGALFEAAVRVGAIAGGGDPEAWAPLGRLIGEAYQIADDIADVSGTMTSLGKPVGQDMRLDRPNAVKSLGIEGAHARLTRLFRQMREVAPGSSDREVFLRWVDGLCTRLLPARRSEPNHEPTVAPLFGVLATV